MGSPQDVLIRCEFLTAGSTVSFNIDCTRTPRHNGQEFDDTDGVKLRHPELSDSGGGFVVSWGLIRKP